MTVIHEDKLLESISYTNGISKETFDQCTFSKCDFSNARVTGCSFTDCIFTDCNFSMTDLSQTTLNNTEFSNCKMLGVKFNHCHDFIYFRLTLINAYWIIVRSRDGRWSRHISKIHR